MNILLYYPRLLIALVFRPVPRCYTTLNHWVSAQLFLLWHLPWDTPESTFGMSMLRLMALRRNFAVDPRLKSSRRKSSIARGVYLFILFAWPFLSALIALRAGKNRLWRWNAIVNNFVVFAPEIWSRSMKIPNPIACTTFLAMYLYIYRHTGRHISDRKDEISDFSRRLGLPTPPVVNVGEPRVEGQKYIVKPINGCCAKGIFFTTDPSTHVANPDFIVQHAVRNPASVRRMWDTDTLASIRFITYMTDRGEYQLAAGVHRIPIGDSPFDNTCHGNAFAVIDGNGVLGKAYTDVNPKVNYSCHPNTGEPIEGAVVERFADCVQLAIKTHRCLAPGMPLLNSDIALTEQGPMLIEINRAPGQYAGIHRDGYSEKCVDAICRVVTLIRRDLPAWYQLAKSPEEELIDDDWLRRADLVATTSDEQAEHSAVGV